MTTDIHQQKIIIIDFGSQYTQLIARRIRELGVYCELHLPTSKKLEKITGIKGIILSGGPESATAAGAPKVPDFVWNAAVPILGICYGMQAMAEHFAGSVAAAPVAEFGDAKLELVETSPLFAHLQVASEFNVWMSHCDHVQQLPQGFSCVAKSASAPIAAMQNLEKKLFALQFHPEVTHTVDGENILAAFARDVCACDCLWQPQSIIEQQISDIKSKVGDNHVVVGLSGGVDSAVVAALLQRAIGQQLTCVFVDTGLLRLNEAQEVAEVFKQHMQMDLIIVDAKQQFFAALQGESDPEQKRKICGALFVRIFEAESKKLDNCKWLGQGTIYPDVIESAEAESGAHVIKSHHNVGGLPEKMGLKLIEPLRELFKDEVRKIGTELGLPKKLISRHPFPGPGLALRVLGLVEKEYVEILQRVDNIFISALCDNGLYDSVSQAFAVFLPVKSVGVTGDQRNYAFVVALRAVCTTDFMTATWADLPHEFLQDVSNKIINSVPEVSRVVYDISGKPPATIEWE